MRKLGVVALVVVGLLVIAQSIQSLSSIAFSIQLVSEGGLGRSVWLQLAITVCGFLATAFFGAALVRYRFRLSTRWFEDSPFDFALDGLAALRAGFILIGLTTAGYAVSRLAWQATSLAVLRIQQEPFGSPTPISTASWLPNVVMLLVQLALGAALVFWSDPLSQRLWLGQPEAVVRDLNSPVCPACGTPFDPADYQDLSSARCTSCHSPLMGDGA